jgi:hypothetical protein
MNKRMTPAAFRAVLARLGLTYHQAAASLGKNKRLIQHWASGHKPIPQLIAELMSRLVLVTPFTIVIRGDCMQPPYRYKAAPLS